MKRIGVRNLARFRYTRVKGGPDKVDTFGPGWSLKSRAKAAQGDAALPSTFDAMKDGLDSRIAGMEFRTPNRGDPLDPNYPDIIIKHAMSGNPRAVVLAGLMQGPRHQKPIKFLVQNLRMTKGYKIRLYFGGGKHIFVEETIRDKYRMFASSICYSSLERAKQVYSEGKITFIHFESLPLLIPSSV